MESANVSPSVEFDSTEVLFDKKAASFQLRCSGAMEKADVSLVMDVYDLDNPVHPQGHVGWWQFKAENLADELTGRLALKRGELSVSIDELEMIGSWQNENRVDYRRLLIIAVLRSNVTNAIVYMDRTPVLLSAEDLTEFRAAWNRDLSVPAFASLPFIVPSRSTVRIVSRNIFVRDAVGGLCLSLYRMLRQNGVSVKLYAENFDLVLNDVVSRVEHLFQDATDDDYVFYFYSTFDPNLERIVELDVEKNIGYFHGITEPRSLQVFDPELSMVCARALEQMSAMHGFDILATNSTYNAKRLIESFDAAARAPRKIPDAAANSTPMMDVAQKPKVKEAKSAAKNARREARARHANDHVWNVNEIRVIPPKLLESIPARREFAGGVKKGAKLLYVGRIKSHKKIEHLLEFYTAYQQLDASSELWIVGHGADKAYHDYLNWVEVEQLRIPEGKVKWFGSIDDAELASVYASATAYVSMSEDEGFCLPVFEAMAAGLPVFAYGIPAVREVMGNTGVYFEDKEFAHLAAALNRLLGDEKRLASLLDEQYERAILLARQMDGTGFSRLIEPSAV
ncbi:glycosyltransferase [Paraburkholderia sp. BR10923]|uniref:glycosyltransferase n=1 Tax=Paraburkholderia sp. BR10923 TaxID=3236992 RepID=UPI0034CD2732